MRYLASNLAHINGIVISTATSIFILVTWVFPSLKNKPQTDIRIRTQRFKEVVKSRFISGYIWATVSLGPGKFEFKLKGFIFHKVSSPSYPQTPFQQLSRLPSLSHSCVKVKFTSIKGNC